MRLFVAAWPPPPVVRELAAIARPARAGIRWTTEDQWHVTLRFLGEVGETGRVALEHELRQLVFDPRGAPVAVQAGPELVRLGSSVLCLPVAGLDGMAALVAERTADVGGPLDSRPFRGHLTIARAARGIDPRPREPVAFCASWTVDEVALVASTLHPDGARYQVLGRFLLG